MSSSGVESSELHHQQLEKLGLDVTLETTLWPNSEWQDYANKIRTAATPNQWQYIAFSIQCLWTGDSPTPKSCSIPEFQDAFDTYPGSVLQETLHSYMDQAIPKLRTLLWRGARTHKRDRSPRKSVELKRFIYIMQHRHRSPLMSLSIRAVHVIHEAYLIALVFFQDTYTTQVMDGFLAEFCRQAWSVMYAQIRTPNEERLFASLGWSVDSVFPSEPLFKRHTLHEEEEQELDHDQSGDVHLDHDALNDFLNPQEYDTVRSMRQGRISTLGRWLRGILPSVKHSVIIENNLQLDQVNLIDLQYDFMALDSMLKGEIPIPLNQAWLALYDQMEVNQRRIIQGNLTNVVGSSHLEYVVDTQLWRSMCEKLKTKQMHRFNFETSSDKSHHQYNMGTWRSFDTVMRRSENDPELSEGDARLTLLYRTSQRLLEKKHWQFTADRFVLKSLSIFEQEVLSTWSRVSTLFRPGFAPNTLRMNHRDIGNSGNVDTSDESLRVIMGGAKVQPRAYECIDAIFKRPDITRVTAREGLWVYRGMALGDDATFTLDSGQYISVSYDKSVCEYFMHGEGVIIHIWLPPGTPFILLDSINEIERELVLPRNHRLRVLTQSTTRRLSVSRQSNTTVAARFAFEWDSTYSDASFTRANQTTIPREQLTHLRKQLTLMADQHNDPYNYIRVLQTLRFIQMIARGQDLASMSREQQINDMLSLLPKSVATVHYNTMQQVLQSSPKTIFISWLNKETTFNAMSNCLLTPDALDGFLASWVNTEFTDEDINMLSKLVSRCGDFLKQQRSTDSSPEINVRKIVTNLVQRLALRGMMSRDMEEATWTGTFSA